MTVEYIQTNGHTQILFEGRTIFVLSFLLLDEVPLDMAEKISEVARGPLGRMSFGIGDDMSEEEKDRFKDITCEHDRNHKLTIRYVAIVNTDEDEKDVVERFKAGLKDRACLLHIDSEVVTGPAAEELWETAHNFVSGN